MILTTWSSKNANFAGQWLPDVSARLTDVLASEGTELTKKVAVGRL